MLVKPFLISSHFVHQLLRTCRESVICMPFVGFEVQQNEEAHYFAVQTIEGCGWPQLFPN